MDQRIQKLASSNPPTQKISSQLTPRVKAAPNSSRPLQQKEDFEQDGYEVSRLQLKENIGGLTSVEQQQLGVLQTQMDNSWLQRREKLSRFGHNIANIPISSPDKQGSKPVQPKLAIKELAPQKLSGMVSKKGRGSVQKAFRTMPAPQMPPMRTLQAKFTIGEPGDKYEQEADSVATKVVHQIHSPQFQQQGQIVQRQVTYDTKNKQLVKNGRLDFSKELQDAMKLSSGQHRCHTISYEIITNGVKDPINDCLAQGKDIALGALDGLVAAVFPNGATSGVYSTDSALVNIAKQNYTKAIAAIQTISKNLTNPSVVAKNANILIDALNNSPDNLRPGAGDTNSSIQGGLDLSPTGTTTLAAKTPIVDAKGTVIDSLKSPLTVITVNPLQQQQVKTLLTKTYSKSSQVAVYSSGKKLQSSDIPGMKTATMSKSNPTHLAINWGSGQYFLFDI